MLDIYSARPGIRNKVPLVSFVQKSGANRLVKLCSNFGHNLLPSLGAV
jgi:hypothetical protein